MSIQEILLNFKRYGSNQDVILTVVVICVGIAGFLLGRASVIQKVPELTPLGNVIENTVSEDAFKATTINTELTQQGKEPTSDASIVIQGSYVASKNGTKYHLPWCSGAKRIKEENKIWFTSKEEAEKAGYEPAANCKGI